MNAPRGTAIAGKATPDAELRQLRLHSGTLHNVIQVVSSSGELRRILDGIVEILSEATECHACFIYLRDGRRLLLRAASRIYAHLVGQVELGLDEGLAGWVARTNTPEFIRENAMADPRMKYVPEMHEERFQSMVAVPIPARSGEVIGVVVLHTEAPWEFDAWVPDFLTHTASHWSRGRSRTPSCYRTPPPRRVAHRPLGAQPGDRRRHRPRAPLRHDGARHTPAPGV